MPLSSRNSISRRLSQSVRGTASAVEKLKLQHAEELATANEDYAKKVESLAHEVEQCRDEIETLKCISDEKSDTLMPLPSPSKSLKFVKNTPTNGRKASKVAAMGGKNAVNMIAGMKMQHRKDLARAAEIYAKKLHSMKLEVKKYKAAETEEAKKTSSAAALVLARRRADGGGEEQKKGCDGTGVNPKTGVAENDKENASSLKQRSVQPMTQSKGQINLPSKRLFPTDKTQLQQQHENGDSKGTCENLNLSGPLKEQYERLFQEEYEFEKDPAWEEVIAYGNVNEAAKNNEEIDVLCKELIGFISYTKAKSLAGQCSSTKEGELGQKYSM